MVAQGGWYVDSECSSSQVQSTPVVGVGVGIFAERLRLFGVQPVTQPPSLFNLKYPPISYRLCSPPTPFRSRACPRIHQYGRSKNLGVCADFRKTILT